MYALGVNDCGSRPSPCSGSPGGGLLTGSQRSQKTDEADLQKQRTAIISEEREKAACLCWFARLTNVQGMFVSSSVCLKWRFWGNQSAQTELQLERSSCPPSWREAGSCHGRPSETNDGLNICVLPWMFADEMTDSVRKKKL